MPIKSRLLASTVVPLAFAAGVGVTTASVSGAIMSKPAFAACAPCNPCAAKPVAANPCNPCAAKNPCNPCAAANPCSPCTANPCAAGGWAGSGECVIPRLAKASVCNPCAAANPCNPCAAANPCNPCAAKNPCNPCAAANPCNPCAAGGGAELTEAEAAKAYDCVIGQLQAAYARSGNTVAADYKGWRRYSRVAYQSATHGERYVQNYANSAARAYGAFERAGTMPAGAILAKDSFAVNGNGRVTPGPLFVMEKMPAGFNAASHDWKYTMIMPNGSVFGETGGRNSAGMQFCYECHAGVAEDQDSMFLLPEEFRIR